MRLRQQQPALTASAKDHEQFLQDLHCDQALAQERPHPHAGSGHEFQIMLTMKTAQQHLPEDRVSSRMGRIQQLLPESTLERLPRQAQRHL
jgi:hypothetical protein